MVKEVILRSFFVWRKVNKSEIFQVHLMLCLCYFDDVIFVITQIENERKQFERFGRNHAS